MRKISFVKFEAFEVCFLGLEEEPFLRSYFIERITFKPLKSVKPNAICLKLFWYKVFLPGKVTLFDFLMDSFLKVTCPARKSTCSDGLPDGTFFNPHLRDQKYCL